MKKFVLVLLFAVIGNLCFSQPITKENEISNAEKFSAKSGKLIQKEFVDIGLINKAEIKVIHYTDLISGEIISAVRIESSVTSSYSTENKIATLDADEIEGLIKSLKLMQEKVFVTLPESYVEVTYKSRSGFEAGCYWSKGVWSTYLKLEKYDGKSYVFLKKEDFPVLLGLLEEAKSKLK